MNFGGFVENCIRKVLLAGNRIEKVYLWLVRCLPQVGVRRV